jgi:hypothetical protein
MDHSTAAFSGVWCRDAALIGTYEKYLVETRDPDTKGPLRADLDTAVAKCRAGDTAGGIPPLEKALRDAQFNLPPRG